MSDKPIAIGAYIFAGGFTVGVSESFNVIAHLEEGTFGVPTFKANFPEIPAYTDRNAWPIEFLKKRKPRLVYCNPPCSPWSLAGKRKGADDLAAQMTLHAFDLIEQLEPDVWVLECVSEALTQDRAMNDHLSGRAAEEGYAVTHFLHDAKFMGLPQSRRRLMTVFSKVKINWPEPNTRIKTAGEALDRVKDPGEIHEQPERARFMKRVKPGGVLRRAWDELHPDTKKGRPGFVERRIDPDKPSPVILGSATRWHPTEPRRLTAIEHAALCGYPSNYKWIKGEGGGGLYAQVGKAVTPPAGRYLGRVIAAALERGEPVDDGEQWLINYQTRSPKLESIDRLSVVERIR